jgi:UDP-N-acetylmuramyl pentapeptide phosphotransferase/UDP-N-acetylglucosamine-1-phosphate transferase
LEKWLGISESVEATINFEIRFFVPLVRILPSSGLPPVIRNAFMSYENTANFRAAFLTATESDVAGLFFREETCNEIDHRGIHTYAYRFAICRECCTKESNRIRVGRRAVVVYAEAPPRGREHSPGNSSCTVAWELRMSEGLIICVLLFTAVGVIDDFVQLKPLEKLLLQFLAGSISFLATTEGSLPEIGWSIIWVIVITNAFNLIDGIDGLAISYACVVLGWSLFVHEESTITAPLLGACIGFMPFNLYRAKYYLGDSGSHALGSAIGYLSIPFVHTAGEFAIADLVIVTLPMADICFVTITRRFRHAHVTTGGTDHIAHRVARLVGVPGALPVLIVPSIVLALISVQARTTSIGIQIAFVLIFWADITFLMKVLERRTRRLIT